MTTIASCKIDRGGVKISESKRWPQVYNATYIIETTGAQGPLRVQIDSRLATSLPHPVPIKGATYNVASEADNSSFAQDFSWRRDTDKADRWFCDVTWRPLDPRDSPANLAQPDPLLRTAVQWWEFEETTELVEVAENITPLPQLSRPANTLGPIVNAAGKPFDSVPERPKSLMVLVIQRAYSSLIKVRQAYDNYAHKINSDTYQGAAVGTLYVRRVSCSQPLYENGAAYFIGQIHIAYDPAGWKFALVNRGLGAGVGAAYRAFDTTGQETTEPLLLALDGTRLPSGIGGNTIDYKYAPSVSFANIAQEPA